MRTYKPKEVERELACSRCGSTYVVHDNRVRKLCPKCARVRYDYAAMNKREKTTGRKCHDCGKATTDYRCAKCHEKWLMQNNIPRDFECVEDVFEVMAAC